MYYPSKTCSEEVWAEDVWQQLAAVIKDCVRARAAQHNKNSEDYRQFVRECRFSRGYRAYIWYIFEGKTCSSEEAAKLLSLWIQVD